VTDQISSCIFFVFLVCRSAFQPCIDRTFRLSPPFRFTRRFLGSSVGFFCPPTPVQARQSTFCVSTLSEPLGAAPSFSLFRVQSRQLLPRLHASHFFESGFRADADCFFFIAPTSSISLFPSYAPLVPFCCSGPNLSFAFASFLHLYCLFPPLSYCIFFVPVASFSPPF